MTLEHGPYIHVDWSRLGSRGLFWAKTQAHHKSRGGGLLILDITWSIKGLKKKETS
ncbi:hypothetical protein HanRHA438_Chr14g0659321 [Helianthus annuus]|nr:hypothetical protein HanIR_Chr14g0703781 [Helianthus annuus]KAJ0486070.1 hypothetical protein HanHA89_Chr14g0575611 [Helianthus annuus]KAJ0854143.1 hypothetical protein HanRHA438_Chr14g0659321 [Helianthus annuus]